MGAERGRRQSPGLVCLAVYLRSALNLCDRETGTGFLDLGERDGAGASFPAPLYTKWADKYYGLNGMKLNYQSIGSGAGIQ